MKPLILVTTPAIPDCPSPGPDFVGARITYSDAVARAGGIPLLVAPISSELVLEAAKQCHGILFTGGEDVHPERYGGVAQEGMKYSPVRDEVELALVDYARKHKVPSLGVCRGMQIWAVGCGAKLLEDTTVISNEITHNPALDDKDAWTRLEHTMIVERDSRLSEIFSTVGVPDVNSLHHQCVDEHLQDAAGVLRVVARAPDGVVEAIELVDSSSFFVGVQSHIEALVYGESPTESRWDLVFDSFIGAARLKL